MSDDNFQRIEVITGTARCRRWSTEQKLRIIEESYEPARQSPPSHAAMVLHQLRARIEYLDLSSWFPAFWNRYRQKRRS